MLHEFITSALIIDDSESETTNLIDYLEEKDIWVKHYTPKLLDIFTKNKKPFNNRKLIFLDLYLENKSSLEDNISKIRGYFKNILGNEFGTYGIVLWTKHIEEFDEFKKRIYKTANKYSSPLFVIPLEKNGYLNKGSFEGILEDLEDKLLKDVSSSFFVEWNKAVKKGSDNTITTLYNLFESNEKKDKNLEAILYLLALNFTGIPINSTSSYNVQKDLVKSLMDTLQFEISNSYKEIINLFKVAKKLEFNEVVTEKNKIFSKLNSLLLLDFQNLSQDSPIPGNIYEISDQTSPLYIKEITYKKKTEDLDTHTTFKDLKKRRVCIEITPPCDFALNKKQSLSRIVGGIQMDYDKDILKGNNSPFKTDNYYTFLYPINVNGFTEPQMIVFDFYRFQTVNEKELKDNSKYKIIIKAKDKLFADVLQKFSSHTARLGIAALYP
ncbi:hypothetical protein [Algoriphagus sp. NG3]|uniref:hypothetical protein n=1 Tax=Algoriphagus sp. NG3 TaxID=3097546 RepID=UPI002A83E4FA|nr:hypothetical protein [Algoriphagus sp. NG3]WPR77700.1 hypothetical protein SLW71_10130 [Algoriphagus sp. NG3]